MTGSCSKRINFKYQIQELRLFGLVVFQKCAQVIYGGGLGLGIIIKFKLLLFLSLYI